MQIDVYVDATFLKIKITLVHYSRASPKLTCAGSSEFGFGVIVQGVPSVVNREKEESCFQVFTALCIRRNEPFSFSAKKGPVRHLMRT